MELGGGAKTGGCNRDSRGSRLVGEIVPGVIANPDHRRNRPGARGALRVHGRGAGFYPFDRAQDGRQLRHDIKYRVGRDAEADEVE
jgi:hypothetical protein